MNTSRMKYYTDQIIPQGKYVRNLEFMIEQLQNEITANNSLIQNLSIRVQELEVLRKADNNEENDELLRRPNSEGIWKR